ncbi:MAG: hypothetical protein JWQ59_1777 [Cryobacterium sp.]|jgi:hypothetical protein|nr:hypothetical protein [Cryobacterium sp.]
MPSLWARGRSGSGEFGGVTAEFATVLPAVVLVLGFCLGAVQLVGQQVRLTDAAADAARALARGDPPGEVSALVRQLVDGASLSPVRRGELLCARLTSTTQSGPLAVFGLTLEASSCALAGGA